MQGQSRNRYNLFLSFVFLSCLFCLIAGGSCLWLPRRNFLWISGPFLTSFSGDDGAKFSRKLKLDGPRKLPGLTSVEKHARRRKGHEAQLSSCDALRSRRTFGVLLRTWRKNLRLRRSRPASERVRNIRSMLG